MCQVPRDDGETGLDYEYKPGSDFEYRQAMSEVRNLSLD